MAENEVLWLWKLAACVVSRSSTDKTCCFGLHRPVKLFRNREDKIVEHAERTMG